MELVRGSLQFAVAVADRDLRRWGQPFTQKISEPGYLLLRSRSDTNHESSKGSRAKNQEPKTLPSHRSLSNYYSVSIDSLPKSGSMQGYGWRTLSGIILRTNRKTSQSRSVSLHSVRNLEPWLQVFWRACDLGHGSDPGLRGFSSEVTDYIAEMDSRNPRLRVRSSLF